MASDKDFNRLFDDAIQSIKPAQQSQKDAALFDVAAKNVSQNLIAPVRPENPGIASGFTAALQSKPVMFGQGIEAAGDVSGIRPLAEFGQKIQDSATKTPVQTMRLADVDGPGEFLTDYLPELAGQGIGSMATSLASGLIGTGAGFAAGGLIGKTPQAAAAGGVAGGIVGAATDALPSNIGEMRQALIAEGVDEQESSKYATIWGSVLSIPDVAVVGKALEKFGIFGNTKDEIRQAAIAKIKQEIAEKKYGEALKSGAKQTARDVRDIAVLEGGTELGQTLGQQAVVSNVADKPLFTPENAEELFASGVSGLFGGGAVALPSTAVNVALTPTPAPAPAGDAGFPVAGGAGETGQAAPEDPPAPPSPSRETLAAAISGDQEAPQAPVTPAAIAQELAPGDIIEHVDRYNQTFRGTVDTIQGDAVHIYDQNGELQTIFKNEGQTTKIAAAIPPEAPTREDLAQALTGQQPQAPAPEKKPQLSDLSVEELQKRLGNIRNQAKIRGWDKRLTKLRDDLEGAIKAKSPEVGKAEEITTAAEQVNTEPTDGQKEAGNYQKGHVSVQGLNVSIENPKGTTRSGTSPDGTAWSVQMPSHYGYIKRTTGADGDQVDVYVGDSPESDNVFVIDQIDLQSNEFDEHKSMIGFSSLDSALAAYNAAFSDGRGNERLGGVTTMTMQEFKAWLGKRGARKAPLAYKKAAKAPDDDSAVDKTPENSDLVAPPPVDVLENNVAEKYVPEATGDLGVLEKFNVMWFRKNQRPHFESQQVFRALATITDLQKYEGGKEMADVLKRLSDRLTKRLARVLEKDPNAQSSSLQIPSAIFGEAENLAKKIAEAEAFMSAADASAAASDRVEKQEPTSEIAPPAQQGAEESTPQGEPEAQDAPPAPPAAAIDDTETMLAKAREMWRNVVNQIAEQEAENMAVDSRLLSKKGELEKLISSLQKQTPETDKDGIAPATDQAPTTDIQQAPAEPEPKDQGEGGAKNKGVAQEKAAGRGKRLKDVGEKMEGKRAFRDDNATSSEQARRIIEQTKPSVVFTMKETHHDGQTAGLGRFAQVLVDNLFDFSEYLKYQNIIVKKSGRRSQTPGWQEQVKLFFSEDALSDGVDIGYRHFNTSQVLAYRKDILDAADDYIGFGERLNSMFESSENIEGFKVLLKEALGESSFQLTFKKFSKTYNLQSQIFNPGQYGVFSRITDDSAVKERSRVEKTLTRPKIDSIERTNMKDHRAGKDITPEQFKDTFGFRGVEFGEWVNAKEGQGHVNQAYDALMDLADRLGISPKHISLGSKLGFAFGSRGSGEHAAHYERETNVINLTKTKGDGSVAHEWLHALDFNLRKNDSKSVLMMNRAYDTLRYQIGNAEKIESKIKDFLRGHIYYQNQKSHGPVGNAKLFVQYLERDPVRQIAVTTDFKHEADSLGKDYWGKGEELLARAWEAFIFDTLPGTSPYLVSSWVAEKAVTKDAGYRGTPYPTGEERARFNEFFTEFLKLVEFSDSGVRFKDGAKLPIEKEIDTIIETAKGFLPKLPEMMKEIDNANIQQGQVPASVSDGDGAKGAKDVSQPFGVPDFEGTSGRGGERSGGDVSRPSGQTAERAGDERGSGTGDGDGNRVRRDDTVPARVEESETIPEFEAKGKNHRIPVGALDEKRGQKQKARDNLQIIKLVKEIESAGRPATPEEQTLLAKYTGWGSVKNAFPNAEGKPNEGWSDIVSEVKNSLTEKEYREARRSIQYAHYTSEIVVRGMWKAMQRMGFKTGNIFEPGMGIGNFVGMMPEVIDAQYSGLEIDTMTARIARILYPESSVRHGDFTAARYADGMFDAAIGNPPFSDSVVKGDPKYNKDKLSLHNYFFAKTIDMVAPGGVIGFVTSRYSMDAMDDTARKKFAEKVDLVGAIRLPDTAFKTNAHTEVVTDIIFLRKRLPGEKTNGVKWFETKPINILDANGNQHHVNEYFIENPEMVLGNFSPGTMYGRGGLTVSPVAASDLEQQISEAVSRLPEGIVTEIQKANTEAMDLSPSEKKEGSYYIKNGRLMQVEQGIGHAIVLRGKGQGGITKADEEKIRALIPIRDSLREAMQGMVSKDEAQMKSGQKALKKAYDAFVKKHGPVTRSEVEARAPSAAQIEDARDELRNDYLAADQDFNEGDIDLSGLVGAINPETGKKYTSGQIAKIREKRREEIEINGDVVDEGDFDPATVPPNISISYPNLDPFKADPEYYNLMILENYDQETGKAETTDVFEKNIVASVEKPEIKTSVDALNYSLATKNTVDIGLMSSELGMNPEAMIEELEQLDLIYRLPNPEGGDIYVYAEQYLSGMVKDKLKYAKKLAEKEEYYKRNVTALEAVQPQDIPASDINTQLGSPYFDTKVITDFLREEMNISASVKYTGLINAWEVNPHDPYAPENVTQHGTRRKSATEIMESLLMRREIKVMDTLETEDGKKQSVNVAETQAAQDKAKAMQEKFDKWVWKSSNGERIFRKYNDEYNNITPRKFDGRHITTAISPSIKLRPHQKNAVWRIMQTGNTYLNHAVGAGKTLEVAVAAMEMRRLGQWRKPMIVVPNHMLAQFSGEFRAAYPQAKIFVADEENFHTDRRKRFVANVAKGDWDAVIMTYSSFKKVPISPDFEAQMIERELDQYRAALVEAGGGGKKKSGRGSTAARLEKQIEKLEGRLKGLRLRDKDQSFTFEELGVDAVMIDEAHTFRKLSFATLQGTMKGVSPVGSKQSWDLYIKSRYLDTVHPGRNLVMASGTPLTNTLAEVYTIQRFMNERALTARGINNFDAWSAVYAAPVTNPERQPSGSYKNVTRLAEFRNLGSLAGMVSEFMDTVTSDELGALVDRPAMKTGKMIVRTTAPTREYLAFQKYLADRTDKLSKRTGKAEKGADIILNVINEGRHAAVDMRLIDPTLPEGPSKLEDMIENVFRIYKESSNNEFKMKYRGDDRPSPVKGATQLIFSDLGIKPRTKNGKTFSAYDHIKRKLVKMGVPSGDIAFISDYDTAEEKRRLFRMVNNGEIKIVIGSTAKMGTGMNVQNRLRAVHNLDAPWLPADLEQRIGRILRQGNQNKEIEVYGYGTEGSYDSTMWGMLETKAKAIIQFLKGDTRMSSMRDIEETDHFRMAKAMTSGDPRVLRQAELQSEVEKLARQSSNFMNEQMQVRSGIASKTRRIETSKQEIKDVEDAQSVRRPLADGEFLMTVSGTPYTERAEAAKALEKAFESIIGTGQTDGASEGIKVGEYQGFNVRLYVSTSSNIGWSYDIFLEHPALHRYGKQAKSTDGGFTGSGAITVLTNSLNKLGAHKNDAEATIAASQREIKVLESQITDKWPKEKEFSDKKAELLAIDEDLQKNAPTEVIYDDYPIEYWAANKESLKGSYGISIVNDDDFLYGGQPVTDDVRLKIEKAVNGRLKKYGMSNAKVVLFEGSAESLGFDKSANAFYDNQRDIIYISMNAPNPLALLDHEVIHRLRNYNVFTPQEWAILESKAKGWREKYGVDKAYAHLNLTESELNEEGIAFGIQHYDQKGPIDRIRRKIIIFFRVMREVLTGKPFEFRNYEDIFDAVQSGFITKRIPDRAARMASRDDSEYRVMYSLSPKKDKALEEASDFLDRVRGSEKTMRPALGKISSYILHPRQISALYEKFTPVYLKAIDMMKSRDVMVHKLSREIESYNHLTKESKRRVNAVLEIGRLTDKNFADEKYQLVSVKNENLKGLHFSKPGETINLTSDESAAYVGVREAMNEALDTYKRVILQEYGYLDQGIANEKDLQKAMLSEKDERKVAQMAEALKMLKDIEAAKRMGYIPLKRWGEIGITIRSKKEKDTDDDGVSRNKLVHYQQVELSKIPGMKKNVITENKEVKDALAELSKQYPDDDYEIEVFEIRDFSSIKSKLNLVELDILAASSDMSDQDYSDMREMLADAMARRGFRSHFFKSKDIPGYDPDFERAINDYIVSISGHLSRRLFMPKFDKALREIEKSGQSTVLDYARKYVDYITDPKEEFGAVRQMAFLWYLAGNVASGVTNALQPIMVTAPWFKAMFPHAQISSKMGAAYADATKMMDVGEAGTDLFNFEKAPDDVRAAMKKADAEGYFIPLNTYDAMAIANTNSSYLRGLDRAARQAMDTVSVTFSWPERTNRVVTFMAAYRFAIDPANKEKIMAFVGRDQVGRKMLFGKSGPEFAEAFADYAVVSTQLTMGRLNRPTLGRGAGTLVFQFKSFSLQMFELMYRLAVVHGGQKGTALGMMIFAVVAMAGLKGFPFEDDVQKFIEKLWKSITRTDLDIDSIFRKELVDLVGPTATEAIMKGLPAALLNVDMSGRLGYGNIVPNESSDLLGVWYDMLWTRPNQAAISIARGDPLQAAADVSPAFLRNMMQAYEWTKSGVRSGVTGDTIIPPEELSRTDIALKAFGWTSADIARERQRVFSEQRANRAVNDLRSDYYDRIARAIAARKRAATKGDRELAQRYQEEIRSIYAEMQKYNEDAPPFKRIIINNRSLSQRVAEELKGASANVVRKQARGEAEELKKAWGEK